MDNHDWFIYCCFLRVGNYVRLGSCCFFFRFSRSARYLLFFKDGKSRLIEEVLVCSRLEIMSDEVHLSVQGG